MFEDTEILCRDVLFSTLPCQSKWGWHPCDKITYLKLKKLHEILLKSVSAHRKWQRWLNKSKQNQFLYKVVRRDGRKVGWAKLQKLEEPSVCPIFFAKKYTAFYTNSEGKIVSESEHDYTFDFNDRYVTANYHMARTPYPTVIETPRLTLSYYEIDKMLERAKEWYESISSSHTDIVLGTS